MTRIALILGFLAVLVSCGVEGDPERPEPEPVQQTPDVTGSVTITNNGIYPGIGVSQGWWSIYIGGGGRYGAYWW